MFTLPHDIPASSHAQDKWRFCRKCQAMFFDGFDAKGVDVCAVNKLSQDFTTQTLELPEVFVRLVLQDSFLTRRTAEVVQQ